MASIQITSDNYNGRTANITFYSVNAPSTAINLGSQSLPYSRTSNDIYGTYHLNFIGYNKTCTVSLIDPNATTTPAPTTTTTTAAPGTTGFIVQAVMNGSDDQYGGTYCEDGTYTYDGTTKPKYRKAGTDYYIYWLSAYGMNVWAINNYGSLGTFASVFVDSDAATPPTTGWYDYDNGGAPTITQTTCASASTTTTTTTTPAPTTTTTTTTTTTAAPSGPKISINRNNGTSTFTGDGASSLTPFTRSNSVSNSNYLEDSDGLSHYSWTATSSCTITIKFDYSDDSESSQGALIYKNGSSLFNDAGRTGIASASNITKSFSLISGETVTFGATNSDTGTHYFSNVSIYAT